MVIKYKGWKISIMVIKYNGHHWTQEGELKAP